MTKEQFAAALDNRQYGEEMSDKDEFLASHHHLVVVFGASDDLIEFRGAIDDELGAYNGATVCLSRAAVGEDWSVVDQETWFRQCHHFGENPLAIAAEWCPSGMNCSWLMKTDIPHAAFNIYEDEDLFCTGLVFSLTDLPA